MPIRFFLLFNALLLGCSTSLAAKPYSIRFSGIEGEILANVEANVSLVRELKENTQISEGQWRRLQRGVADQIRAALQPFGYYTSTISAKNDGDEWVYQVNLGQPVTIREVQITLQGPAVELPEYREWREQVKLPRGATLLQENYRQAKKSLQALNLRLGFFDAELVEHQITIDESRTKADIRLTMISGQRYRIGGVDTEWAGGNAQLQSSVLAPFIDLATGQVYDADKVALTQAALQGTPYFSAVEVRPELEQLDNGKVPLKIALTPQKPHAFNFAFGAGTDTGLRGSVGYENRLLNIRGHNLSARIGASQIRKTAILNYRIPLASSAQDSINLLTSFEEEDSDFKRFELQKLGAELAKKWRDSILNFGMLASREKFFLLDQEQTIDLILPSVGWQKIVSDDPYFPTRGWSADLRLRGASESLGSDIDLLQFLADAKVVLPLFRGRLLGRVQAATTDIDDPLRLPASLGFLTGGDSTVRGYKYQSIGVPADGPGGRSIAAGTGQEGLRVGQHLAVASVEYEHPLKNQFAVAAFIDVGDAFNQDLNLKRGAGLGLRWRLPFGALRIDLASALDREGDPLRLHLSFGSSL